MLTRVFWLLEERTRYSLKPLLNHYLFRAPSTFAGLDYRLRRAALYPAELRVPVGGVIRQSESARNQEFSLAGAFLATLFSGWALGHREHGHLGDHR